MHEINLVQKLSFSFGYVITLHADAIVKIPFERVNIFVQDFHLQHPDRAEFRLSSEDVRDVILSYYGPSELTLLAYVVEYWFLTLLVVVMVGGITAGTTTTTRARNVARGDLLDWFREAVLARVDSWLVVLLLVVNGGCWRFVYRSYIDVILLLFDGDAIHVAIKDLWD